MVGTVPSRSPQVMARVVQRCVAWRFHSAAVVCERLGSEDHAWSHEAHEFVRLSDERISFMTFRM